MIINTDLEHSNYVPPAVYPSTTDLGNLQTAVNMTKRIMVVNPNTFPATPATAVIS